MIDAKGKKAILTLMGIAFCFSNAYGMGAYAVKELPAEHPRLFGSKQELVRLAAARRSAYDRMKAATKDQSSTELELVFSLSLVYAIEGDESCAKRAISIARDIIARPLKVGHETFATEMSKVAIVWDHCFDKLSTDDKKSIVEWINKEYTANIDVETHVFFNGYYGYKMWGFGMAGYATWPDNPKAREIIDFVTKDVIERAIPAQKFGGDGGGWSEGYYVHYFLYYWLIYCETARRLEGIDYYSMAPEFFSWRAVAEMFECYPGTGDYNARRMPCWGDGRSGGYGSDTDMALCCRRILSRYFMDKNPLMRLVAAFDRETPHPGAPPLAYMDFLFDDSDLPVAPLDQMKLAHLAKGAGHVWARSSWKDDATWVFFKAGRRLAGHQHLDMGHFAIYKYGVLASDSGEYATFDDEHTISYYMRTIAHNAILIFDPREAWKSTRSGKDGANDGGQAYPWSSSSMSPNGSARDMHVVEACRQLVDISEITAYEDTPLYTYAVGDITHAYASSKMQAYTRHFLFVRPDNVVVFDVVTSKKPELKKTWLLHTVNEPSAPGGEQKKESGLFTCSGDTVTAVNGEGTIICQTLLPKDRTITKIGGKGDKDYWYGGRRYAPSSDRDALGASSWRIEVSPSAPSATDFFLHVITVGKNKAPLPPPARLVVDGSLAGAEFAVANGVVRVYFDTTGQPGGRIEFYTGGVLTVSQPLPVQVNLEPGVLRPPEPKPATNVQAKTPKPEQKTPQESPEELRKKADDAAGLMRTQIIKSVVEGKPVSAFVNVMGTRMKGRIAAADGEGVSVEVAGVNMKMLWVEMSAKDFYSIAREVVSDHALLYVYCIGMGLTAEAEAEKAVLEKA